MLGDFTFCNPTRLDFGRHALDRLRAELSSFGPTVQLIYGAGSIKRTGVYDHVTNILAAAGKTIVEDAGVMPNPTIDRVREGVQRARENHVDLLLAVGGGSCIDYAKAVSVSVNCDAGEDLWDKYWRQMEEPTCPIVPVGAVLTMAGTGSEMNGSAVITNEEEHLKVDHLFGPEVHPKFAILNPEFTFTVPRYHVIAGTYDILNHIMEQYFSGTDDCANDYLMEGLMRSVIHSGTIAVADLKDYESRSNLMWAATWALNTFLACGKPEDWEIHMIGHAVGAVTDATHGMALSAVTLPYYRTILPYGTAQFAKFARNVWHVDAKGKTETELAEEGLDALERWMRELGCVMSLSELGVTEDMLGEIADGTFICEGGYHRLSRDEVMQVLKESL
mgnify:CR=1 FL=1